LGGLGNVGAPAPQPAPNPGKRSDVPDGVTPTSAQVTQAAWPFLPADASGIGGVLKYASAEPAGTTTEPPLADPNDPGFPLLGSTSDDNLPERRLARRTGNLSPAPASTNAPPLAPAAASPALGIFSGQPMPNWPVPPPIWGFPDNSQSSDDNELYQRWRRMLDA
jgi:hypothetical protein